MGESHEQVISSFEKLKNGDDADLQVIYRDDVWQARSTMPVACSFR